MKKVVVITGVSRGLGLELARKFIAAGDTVLGISQNKKNWSSVRELIPSKSLELIHGDVSHESDVKRFLQKVQKKAGRIDILINNAGYCGPLRKLEQVPEKEFEKHLAVNLTAVFLMCKYAIPVMRKQKQGLIINISSMAGLRAVPNLAAYSASKFGVLALSQCIAKENAETRLKCITVCPGGMNTQMRKKLFGAENAAKQQSPEFVADVILQVINGKIDVQSGGDIVIRYGQITAIHPCPPA